MGGAVQRHGDAWDEYRQWQRTDRAALRRINELIKEARRDPYGGIGKPEPLKHSLSGLWSRRINETDRLTYFVENDILVIVGCKGHYDD